MRLQCWHHRIGIRLAQCVLGGMGGSKEASKLVFCFL
jgi:hypothetical protein